MFKIGTLADWFGVGLLEGIRESERCGATGVQIYAWNELNPLTITAEELKRIKKTAVDCHQEITALCGELGGHGLEIAKDNGKKLEYLKRTVDVALELDCNVVTTHIGRALPLPPLPPLAATKLCSFSTKSASTSPVSAFFHILEQLWQEDILWYLKL